jgi:ABC-2 type transport system ATP-binding protein
VIAFESVVFGYREEQRILDAVDLIVPAGLTLLLGRNGSGKSTLLKVAAGVERPDQGRVLVAGRDLWREEVSARRELAYVPEQADFTPYATVTEVLRLVCTLRGEAATEVGRALEKVGLDGYGERSVRELSMGQRRRAMLAAALIGSPTHLLLDEPLESLDRRTREEVVAWILDRTGAGATLIVSTHDPSPFVGAASRALTLAAGRATIQSLPSERGVAVPLLDRLTRGEPLSEERTVGEAPELGKNGRTTEEGGL